MPYFFFGVLSCSNEYYIPSITVHMNNEIAKSPELVQKEARVKELQKLLKKKRATLKGLKTRLENTKQEVEKVQREAFETGLKNQERFEYLQNEIKVLLQEIEKWKNLSVEESMLIESFLSQIVEADESIDMQDKAFEDFLESEEFERMHQERVKGVFDKFKVEPSKEDKRKIRKIFIGLSNRFHPDKAQNDKDREAYHKIQQQINEAYTANDIDKLLELEQLYQETVEVDDVRVDTDGLNSLIEKLERDIDFIVKQSKRTSLEIKELRNSEMGNMLTKSKKSKKKAGVISTINDDFTYAIENLDSLHKALKKCKKAKSLDALYDELERLDDEMMRNNMSSSSKSGISDDASLLDMLDDILADGFEDEDNFADDVVYREPVKKPKFPIGSSVKIKNDIYINESIPWNLYESQGRVLSAYKVGSTIRYEIELDSLSVKRIPDELVDALFYDDIYFFIVDVSASNLKKVKERDAKAQTVSANRKIFHSRNWDYMEAEDQEMMKDIMLIKSAKSDVDNWKIYLTEQLEFPFKAISCAALNIQPNKEVEVLGFADFSHELGHRVEVKYKNKKIAYPFKSLRAKPKSLNNILKLYRAWWKDVME